MKVLVIGATGKFAGLVVPELKQHGATVRALIREVAESDAAHQRGADETAIGNLTDVASLRKAMDGCDGLFFLNPNFMPDEGKVGADVVEAAKATGIPKVVFSSVIHPSLDRMKNHSQKRPVEAALYESGLTFTILQPTMFMQTLDMAWPSVRATGKLAQPFSKIAKLSYVDYRDVAEAAALALTSNKLDYGTFELCSPGMTDAIELAGMLSERLNRQVEAVQPSFDEWAKAAKLPAGPALDGLRIMYEDFDRFGFPGGNSVVLQAVLGREPRTLNQYVQQLVMKTPEA